MLITVQLTVLFRGFVVGEHKPTFQLAELTPRHTPMVVLLS
jgi:hypothetical protein